MRSVLNAAIGTALALPFLTAPASAQFLSFVSATGNDANSCFVQASPCKTLQRAINQTSAGGEVRILSTLPAQLVTVAKSLTIDGGDNTMIGTITINSASAIVRLRKLSLTGRHAVATGVNIINAAAVHIEESSFERYASDGISLRANVSTELFISNSVSRDNGSDGIEIDEPTAAKVTIENSRFLNNNAQGILIKGGQGSVSRSIAFGNNVGVGIESSGKANVVDTVAAANGDAGFVTLFGTSELTLESCEAHRNANQGIFVGSGTTMRISNCTITANEDEGILTSSGTVLTRGNNLVAGNNPNTSGTITPLPGE